MGFGIGGEQAAGYTRSAQGNSAGAVEPRGPLNMEMRDRLSRLEDILGGASSRLAGLRERYCGPWPEEAGRGTGDGAVAKMPVAEEMIAILDHLIRRARTIQDHAEFLGDVL